MKKVLTAVGIAAALTTGAVVYINGDGGGSVYDYARKYDAMQAQGLRIQISGACYSSCTMALGYPNACFTRNAVLGFHPAYIQYGFGLFSYRIHPQATEEMRRHYPPDALAIINNQNGLRDKGGWLRPAITLIKVTEFPSHYLCDRSTT